MTLSLNFAAPVNTALLIYILYFVPKIVSHEFKQGYSRMLRSHAPTVLFQTYIQKTSRLSTTGTAIAPSQLTISYLRLRLTRLYHGRRKELFHKTRQSRQQHLPEQTPERTTQ